MDPKVQRRGLFVVPWVVECGSLASAHRIVQPNESKKLDRAEPLLRSIEETPGAQRKMFKLFRQSLAPVPGDFIQGGAVLEPRECARHRYFSSCSSSQNF
jgi:hypothetical protein